MGFLGIGAQKAGTTWLYRQLATHPGLGFPRGKEIHYWDWVQLGRRAEDTGWYAGLFAGHDARILGEITPAYAVLEQRYIRKIHGLNPELRLFFILRNPIERAWSAARMGLERVQMRREEASEQWFIDIFRSQASLTRGDYEWTLRNWRAVFDPEQILLLYFEDLRRDPVAVLRAVAAHLGVEPAFFEGIPRQELERRVHRGRDLPLTPVLAAELRRLYAQRIRSLSRYLGRDLSHWLGARGAV